MDRKQQIDKALENAKNGFKIWTIAKVNLFPQYEDNSGASYFGSYEAPSHDGLCSVDAYVLEGESPVVYAPKELTYFGKVANCSNEDDFTYVFRDEELENVYYDPHWFYETPFEDKKFMMRKILNGQDTWKNLYLTKEEAAEECRALNGKRKSHWSQLNRTLKEMQARLDKFIKDEYILNDADDEDDED